MTVYRYETGQSGNICIEEYKQFQNLQQKIFNDWIENKSKK